MKQQFNPSYLRDQVASYYQGDVKPIEAALKAEGTMLADFRMQRNALLDRVSVAIIKAIKGKDRSKVMQIFHAASKALNANAEQVNGVLEEFAGQLANSAFRKWTPKVQHALTQRVQLGESTDMTTGDFEYKGFDGDEVVPFLMTWTKEKWVKRANRKLYDEIASMVIEIIMAADGDRVASEAVVLSPEAIEYRYGQLSAKTMFRVVGSIATKAALFEKYAYVSDEGIYTTRTIERMKDSIERREGDIAYASSNHYVQESADELEDKRTQLASWELATALWAELKPLVEDYNTNMELLPEDERYPLPTGDLQEIEERQFTGLMESLNKSVDCEQSTEFHNKLKQAAEDAAATLDALLN